MTIGTIFLLLIGFAFIGYKIEGLEKRVQGLEDKLPDEDVDEDN